MANYCKTDNIQVKEMLTEMNIPLSKRISEKKCLWHEFTKIFRSGFFLSPRVGVLGITNFRGSFFSL